MFSLLSYLPSFDYCWIIKSLTQRAFINLTLLGLTLFCVSGIIWERADLERTWAKFDAKGVSHLTDSAFCLSETWQTQKAACPGTWPLLPPSLYRTFPDASLRETVGCFYMPMLSLQAILLKKKKKKPHWLAIPRLSAILRHQWAQQ